MKFGKEQRAKEFTRDFILKETESGVTSKLYTRGLEATQPQRSSKATREICGSCALFSLTAR